MADPVQSSNVNDFSKDADVLAAKIEMVKKQVDQLAGSLSSVNSQFTKFGKAAGKTYNPKINVSTGSGSSSTHGLSENERLMRQGEANAKRKREQELKDYVRKAQQYQKEEERLWLATERWKRHKVQREEVEYAAYKKRQEKEEAAAEKLAQKVKREKEEKAAEEAFKKTAKGRFTRLGKLGNTLAGIFGLITMAIASFGQAIKKATENVESIRWSNINNAVNNFAKSTEETSEHVSNTFSQIWKSIGNGFAKLVSWIGPKKDSAIANAFSFLEEDQYNELYSSYVGTANQTLFGLGASGKLTQKMAEMIVENSLRQARIIGGYSSDFSDADLLNTGTYKNVYNKNLGLVSSPSATWFTGYKAMQKGYGFAMTDLSPEENMALMSSAIAQLSKLDQKQANDLIKQWTKTGRVVEKFGKNLYAFDEVLTNDPFSNEDVEDIDKNTGDIIKKMDDENDTTKKIGDDIIPPVDDINKTSKELEETADSILDRLEKLKLNIKIPVDVKINIPGEEKEKEKEKSGGLIGLAFQRVTAAVSAVSKILGMSGLPVGDKEKEPVKDPVPAPVPAPVPVPAYVAAPDKNETYSKINAVYQKLKEHALAYGAYLEFEGYTAKMKQDDAAANEYIAKIGALEQLLGSLMDLSDEDYALTFAGTAGNEFFNNLQKLSNWSDKIRDGIGSSLFWSGLQSVLEDVFPISLAAAAGLNASSLATLLGLAAPELGASTIGGAIAGIGGAANGAIGTRKMPTLSALFEQGPEMVLPLNNAGADFLATSLNNLGLSNRLTNNSANVNVNLSGINIADNDREWYEVAHKIHNIIEAEQARQGG